jgi:chain length determinant protein EpsF
MNIHQFLLALRGRFWVFLSLLVATVVAAVIVTVALPKTYDATVAILVDNRDEQSLSGTLPSARERTGFMQTQVDIIQSQSVARRVVDNLKLADDARAREAFAKAKAPGTIEDWIATNLLLRLKVDSSQSSVIQIQYSANDAKAAANIANAFAKAYMEETLRLRTEPTRQAAGWFDEQLKSLRTQFEQAQRKLSAYEREKGIVATDERVDVEMARLNQLSTQALTAQDMAFDSSSRSSLASRNASPESLPEVLSNPLIQTLKGQLLTQEAALSEMSTRLGPNHPAYQQQAQQIASLRGRLNNEMSRVVSGAQNTTSQNRARQASLQQALDAQRQRVIELRAARNEALVLTREVETTQKAYEAALSRYLVNKVESGARQTNVTVLNAATEPTRASKPKSLLNIILGFAVGIVLGLGAVFLLELLDRRVRSSDDLEEGLEAPLLATLQPWKPSHLLGGPTPGNNRALPSPA